MNILALDISGNHASEKEGSGTTGVAMHVEGWESEIIGKIDSKIELDEVKASDYETTEAYWHGVLNLVHEWKWDHVVIEGYRLYNHKGMSASMQANSTLMTSQLLGAIRYELWVNDIPYTIQYAADVKTRWADKILIANGYLEEGNKFKGKLTNDHRRDALRHLVHYMTYKMEG